MKKHFAKNTNAAFTLMEMAIVLTVVGIVISGVMVGQSLVQASKLNEVIANLQNYKKAYESFYDHYKAVPGDMIDATDVLTPFSGITVHDGDGDNIIEHNLLLFSEGESINAWNHLAMAGFIKGKYKTDGAATTAEAVGYNIPAGPHKGSAYYMVNAYQNANAGVPFMDNEDDFIADVDGSYENTLLWSNSIFYLSYVNYATADGVLSPKDVYSIDKKIDNGDSLSGAVSGLDARGAASACLGVAAGSYNVDSKTENCILLFNVEKHGRPQ